MPAGRPSSYDESYCIDVIEYGRAGKSRAWIASEIGVSRQTIGNWESAHPEFLYAMGMAADLSQRWWEDAGQNGLTQQGFNGSVYSRSMAARFPHDWREKTLHGSDPENPLPSATVLNVSGLSESTLRELAGTKEG